MDSVFNWLGEPGKEEFTSLLLAAAAIAVSIIAICLNRKTQKRLLSIEENREKESDYKKKKALLIARGVKELHSKGGCSFYLILENIGDAGAREVNVLCDGIPVHKHKAMNTEEPIKEKLEIGQNSWVRYLLVTGMKDAPFPNQVEIKWQDDTGEEGYYCTDMSYL